jgi:hypothetical protein
VQEKSLEKRRLRISPSQEEAELAASRAAELLGLERTKEEAPTEAVGCTIDASQEAKTITRAEIVLSALLEVTRSDSGRL